MDDDEVMGGGRNQGFPPGAGREEENTVMLTLSTSVEGGTMGLLSSASFSGATVKGVIVYVQKTTQSHRINDFTFRFPTIYKRLPEARHSLRSTSSTSLKKKDDVHPVEAAREIRCLSGPAAEDRLRETTWIHWPDAHAHREG
ncbi:unnamed protein product, partial [Pleuronectes platessa]